LEGKNKTYLSCVLEIIWVLIVPRCGHLLWVYMAQTI